ncbi:uncharacterized protein V1518DRAFT_410664 [Limtongia smithiae]|uniref:uncharacterized protein n=1 Tax=Limtongia smithiae TaxID=1125753 RepID=UPI0034CDCBB2
MMHAAAPGKSAPLVVREIVQYLPGSRTIGSAYPQLPLLPDAGISIAKHTSLADYLAYSTKPVDNTVHLARCAHDHHLISSTVHRPTVVRTTDANSATTPPPQQAESDLVTTKYNSGLHLVCSVCRYHFDVHFEKGVTGDCGTAADNLHHFVLIPATEPEPAMANGVPLESVSLGCSICFGTLSISVHPPRITDDIVATFAAEHIRARVDTFNRKNVEAAQAANSTELPKIVATPTVLMCYETLNSIITKLLQCAPGETPQSVSATSVALHTKLDAEILTKFFFVKDESINRWVPPNLSDDTDEARRKRRALEESIIEIALLYRTATKNRENPFQLSLDNEITVLKRYLSCTSYSTTLSMSSSEVTNPATLRCASLGALPDFSDRLLLQCFDRQTAVDPSNSAYYLECLRELSTSRSSEELQIRVVELQSLGLITREDLKNAYNELGIETPHAFSDDSLLLGVYKARLQGSPRTSAKLKSALKIIADARDSDVLKSFLQAENLDEEQSLQTLGVYKDTDDDMLISSFDLNFQENTAKRDLYNSALVVIAKARRSPKLLSYAESRDLTGPLPELSEAYSAMGIQSSFEDSHLLTVFDIRVNDTPDEILTMRNALRAIGLARKSGIIKHFLETGEQNYEPVGTETEPVGLQNIGNTCYLNSLLQYYFTVKPLRSLILSFDELGLKDDIAEAAERSKRIGGRKVTAREINRSIEFVHELGGLFQNMITSRQSSVAPNHRLAYLALVSSKETMDEEEKEDTAVSPINTAPAERADVEMTDNLTEVVTTDSATDGADTTDTEATLVSENLPPVEHAIVEISDDEMEHSAVSDKENVSPMMRTMDGRSPTEEVVQRQVLGEIKSLNPSPTSTMRSESADTTPAEGTTTKKPLLLLPAPTSSTAPPPPPRRDSNMMFGNQQDVTECIENVLFQIEAALRPDSVAEDGEQIDLVKKLFFGSTKQTLEVQGGDDGGMTVRTKEERFSHIIVDVASGPRDIYDALDACFDVEIVDLDGRPARRYVTIAELPPILQIQVQRVQYDRALGRAFKSTAPLRFERVVYMDRYMDTLPAADGDYDVKALREEMWAWKAELAALEKRRTKVSGVGDAHNGLTTREMLAVSSRWLEQVREAVARMDEDEAVDADNTVAAVGVNGTALIGDVLSTIDDEVAKLAAEAPALEARIAELESKIAAQFADLRTLAYTVHAVFIHRGQATYGHYWIYIYDVAANVFRQYNDGRVSECSEDEVMATAGDAGAVARMKASAGAGTVSEATPYFLVFVRQDQTQELVEAVCRRFGEMAAAAAAAGGGVA